MSIHRITLETKMTGQSVSDLLFLQQDDNNSISRVGDLFYALASGVHTSAIRFNINAVQASGTITFSSFADADTVTVNGVVLTGKTSPSGASQFAVGASDEACANNFCAKINASALASIVGVVAASRRATVALSSFVDGDTVTINSVIFTGKTTPTAGNQQQFAVGSTDAITANNLMAAINNFVGVGLSGITVTISSATLTLNYNGTLTVANSAHATVSSTIAVVVCLTPGTIGNLCTLAISAHGSAVTPTGGAEGTQTVYQENFTYSLL